MKSSDRLCGEHFVSGRPSRDPKNVDYVPTLFKDGKRRAVYPIEKGRKEAQKEPRCAKTKKTFCRLQIS